MKRIYYLLLPFAVFLLPSLVSAQTRLTYPIADLGYCRDAKECYLYCEIPENKAACWSYGKYKVGSDVLGVATMNDEEKRMMEKKAKQYNITFPIAELGGCAGPQECRDYCEQPTNQTTCMDFAKKKGFAKEMEQSGGMDATKRDELLQQAKTELGCTSMESCSSVCESNPSRCEAFARKHGVYQQSQSQGRYSSEEKQQLMEKAKSELGCTSMESCKSTCEQNPQRCMEFAKKHGLDKGQEQERQYQYQQNANYGTQRFGKGGCDSEESCKQYCQEHPDECPGYRGYSRATQGGSGGAAQQTTQQSQGSYMSPSGCRTQSECESWCNANPDQCPGFSEGKSKEEQAKRESKPTTNTRQYYDYRPSSGGSQTSGGGSSSYPSTSTQPAYQMTQPPTDAGSSNYPSTSSQPSYQTTQPSTGTYQPPNSQPAAP